MSSIPGVLRVAAARLEREARTPKLAPVLASLAVLDKLAKAQRTLACADERLAMLRRQA